MTPNENMKMFGWTPAEREVACLPKPLPALRTAQQAGVREAVYEAVVALVRARPLAGRPASKKPKACENKKPETAA